ncbi:methylated-DNA--[protein]-cysteine S-methyltransferase [Serratia proteamaculans]|jgi:methylated-DNA-[protein]-cysteine S-methyltransferase|uniref:Methylated-DNA--protein-cysteine methyltransferase n=1 Tax=Serratia proteamaculans TaxID=28151 RepID=A0A7U0N5G1_SERPR|nr:MULTISPECIES: methylated-DNA--[protein]-cysteine S-methyltransferase [Serratia]MBO1501665.1 methylated-DNA--[protein]-cysteine S-methyltransferase [Serratia proteamaculans]MDW5508397.1 methylated-DNA--[protein]-cysteine S-methyltransferase [Serratia proteamaculans]QQX52857.1 methylated-DNA--[protein]-cysteine S-methyltransferase [Serratia proteamaculans]WEO87351.1 methylated-DNA--[protein]-cysteine S-methyltransferase [Serratia proteamaculans]CAI1609892.1 Methylated-DNA--protein-cysteine me
MQTFFIDRMATPVGELVLIADEQDRLRAIDWTEHEVRLMKLLNTHYRADRFQLVDKSNPGGLTDAMQRYFSGELDVIDQLPVMTAGTEFQRSVWQQLRQIPCGEIITYGELAKRIGRPTASRAVGMANGSNPISIVVPCHRVIGSQGALTGYAGGVQRKQWLLKHEGYLQNELL